jgi:cyclopentanol dehydrogenase
MKKLTDKVVLITGAAKGMGEAEARLFATHGAALILTDIDTAVLNSLATELTASGTKVLALMHDVASETDWLSVSIEAEKAFGKVDVLINNAGIVDLAGIEATTKQTWDRIIAVNQTGTWLGMKYIIPLMKKAGGGSIINIASIYALIGSGTSAAYQASKGAVRILSKTAAMEYASQNIRVNSIYPGAIETPMSAGVDEQTLKGLLTLIPMKRMGKAMEVAKAALFLACEDSSYMTGSELVIDGGWTIP